MPDILQRAIGAVALMVSAPLVLALALLVRLDSRGPAIYRARRMGTGGRTFTCFKLRTMQWRAPAGAPRVTRDSDSRVTRVGRLLRRVRLDELPQLLNVVRGEMNLVGPRPEDPRYVDFDAPGHRVVFRAKPGITGLAQLAFADEAKLLTADITDADAYYRTAILPRKVEIDLTYLAARSWRLDAWILGRTALAAAGRPTSIDRAPLGR